MLDINTELEQYIATALWSSHDDAPEGDGPMLDENYEASDLSDEARESMRADLVAFVESAPPLALEYWRETLGAGQVGHDFWLTRNGHGAGFWDRFANGTGSIYGRALTDLSRPYGESNLYVGDDGQLHVS